MCSWQNSNIFLFLCLGKDAQEAVEIGLNQMEKRVGGNGGCIALDNRGNIGIYFNVEGMAWSYCRDNQLHYGIFRDEDNILII